MDFGRWFGRPRAGGEGGRRGAEKPLLERRARPLLNPDLGLMVLWSPKSACTSAYAWFAAVSGFADEIAEGGGWPHAHRGRVYQKGELYRRGLETPLERYRIVRVIRDPHARTVSLYRHALRTSFFDDEMQRLSGGRLGREAGYSFSEFLDALERLDVTRHDSAVRPQRHDVETVRRPDHVVNISTTDMFDGLNAAAAALGLPHVDFAAMPWLHATEARRRAVVAPVEAEDGAETRFDRRAAEGERPFPSYDRLLTPKTRARIERLYAVDFEAYRDVIGR